MQEQQLFSGRVLTGLGRGAFFVGLDWVVAGVERTLGFTPYPGTLNLAVDRAGHQALTAHARRWGLRIAPPGGGCGGILLPVQLAGHLPGAIVFPDTTEHAPECVELLAPVRLRQRLALADGHVVRFSVREPAE